MVTLELLLHSRPQMMEWEWGNSTKLLIGNESRHCWGFFVVQLSCTCHPSTPPCLQPTGTVNRWRCMHRKAVPITHCELQWSIQKPHTFFFILFQLFYASLCRGFQIFSSLSKSHYQGKFLLKIVMMEIFRACQRKPRTLTEEGCGWLYIREKKVRVW